VNIVSAPPALGPRGSLTRTFDRQMSRRAESVFPTLRPDCYARILQNREDGCPPKSEGAGDLPGSHAIGVVRNDIGAE
jgi:hypothetical protein